MRGAVAAMFAAADDIHTSRAAKHFIGFARWFYRIAEGIVFGADTRSVFTNKTIHADIAAVAAIAVVCQNIDAGMTANFLAFGFTSVDAGTAGAILIVGTGIATSPAMGVICRHIHAGVFANEVPFGFASLDADTGFTALIIVAGNTAFAAMIVV